MKRSTNTVNITAPIKLAPIAGRKAAMDQATGGTENITVSDPVAYARVFTDSTGETHFADEALTFTLVDYAPPAAPISVSARFDAQNVSFISSPPYSRDPTRYFYCNMKNTTTGKMSAKFPTKYQLQSNLQYIIARLGNYAIDKC